MDNPSNEFTSLFDSPVEIALVNGETLTGFFYLYFRDPGRILLVTARGSVVVPKSAILGIVAAGPRDSEARPSRSDVADIVDMLGAPARVTLLAGGEWLGRLVDFTPGAFEFIGIARPDGSTVFVPLAAVATMEPAQ